MRAANPAIAPNGSLMADAADDAPMGRKHEMITQRTDRAITPHVPWAGSLGR